jgi:hypothetical protein
VAEIFVAALQEHLARLCFREIASWPKRAVLTELNAHRDVHQGPDGALIGIGRERGTIVRPVPASSKF